MKILLSVALLLFISSCSNNYNKKGVEKAMQHYDYLIQKMDADSIALLFMADGNLGDIAHGRDSIKKFLSSFKNVKVISQSSVTDSIIINKDTSRQTGSYKQVVLIPGKDTLRLKGTFKAVWIWVAHDGWRIKSMQTAPAS